MARRWCKRVVFQELSFARDLARRSGVILPSLIIMVILIPALLLWVTYEHNYTRVMSRIALGFSAFFLIPQLLLYTAAILYCQSSSDSTGVRSLFPMNWRVLPVSYPNYVCLQFLTGFVAMAACVAMTWGLTIQIAGTWFPFFPALFLFEVFYALGFATMSILSRRLALVIAFLLLEAVAIVFLIYYRSFLLSGAPLSLWAALGFTFATAFCLSVWALSREPSDSKPARDARRKEHTSKSSALVPNPLVSVAPRVRQRFKNSFASICWLERKQDGWILPAIVLSLVVFETVIEFGTTWELGQARTGIHIRGVMPFFVQIIMYMGGLLLGMRRLSASDDASRHFVQTLPINHARMAWAILASLFYGALLSHVFMELGFFISPDMRAQWNAIKETGQLGNAVLPLVFAESLFLFLREWVFLSIGMSAMLSGRSVFVLLAMLAFPAYIALNIAAENSAQSLLVMTSWLLWLLAAGLLAAIWFAAWLCRDRRLLSSRFAIIAATAITILVAAVGEMSYILRDSPIAFLKKPPIGLPTAIVMSALSVAPILWAPLALSKRRE